jgi:hypothetical protein
VKVGVPTSVADTAPVTVTEYRPGTSGVNENPPAKAAVTAVLFTAVLKARVFADAVMVVKPVACAAARPVTSATIEVAATRLELAGIATNVAVN